MRLLHVADGSIPDHRGGVRRTSGRQGCKSGAAALPRAIGHDGPRWHRVEEASRIRSVRADLEVAQVLDLAGGDDRVAEEDARAGRAVDDGRILEAGDEALEAVAAGAVGLDVAGEEAPVG